MSAPPLPEVFGNYALGDFVEVVSPAAVSWLPQTSGWLWLGVFVLGWAGHRTWQWLRHWHANRYRREAVVRLQQLGASGERATLVSDANKLLKLAAMAASSRQEVARLSGQEWIAFLNQRCAVAVFSEQQSQLLAQGIYRSEAPDDKTCSGLIDACLRWVSEHRGPGDD